MQTWSYRYTFSTQAYAVDYIFFACYQIFLMSSTFGSSRQTRPSNHGGGHGKGYGNPQKTQEDESAGVIRHGERKSRGNESTYSFSIGARIKTRLWERDTDTESDSQSYLSQYLNDSDSDGKYNST